MAATLADLQADVDKIKSVLADLGIFVTGSDTPVSDATSTVEG